LSRTAAKFNPRCGAHPFDRVAVCPRSRIVVRGRLLSEKAAVETYCTLICGLGSRIRLRHAHSKIFSEYLKKLARTAYKFNCGLGPQVKAFLLRTNVDLKNRSFKTVDQKNLRSHILGLMHPPICFSDTLFS
jgi:hypothetical protein